MASTAAMACVKTLSTLSPSPCPWQTEMVVAAPTPIRMLKVV